MNYSKISEWNYEFDRKEETKLVLPKTISDKDISHWSINYNDTVKVYNVKGVIIGSFLSQRKAAKELGVSHNLVSRYGKSTDTFLSPTLGMRVSVSIENVEKSDKVIHPSAKQHPKLNLNLDLPKNKICAISSDLSKIVNTFNSFNEAAKFFDLPDYRRIRRYFGTDKLIKTSKGNFYFTGDIDLLKHYEDYHPIQNKSILAYELSNEDVNIITEEKLNIHYKKYKKIYLFKSINQAERELNIHHTFISKHLDKGTIYKGQDGRKFIFKLAKDSEKSND